MLSKATLKQKLYLLASSLLIFSVIVGGVSVWGINNLDGSIKLLVDQSIPTINKADSMYLEYSKLRIALRTLGLNGLTKDVETKALADVERLMNNYETLVKEYKAIPYVPGEKDLFDGVEKDWLYFKETVFTVLKLYKENTKESHSKMIQIFLVDCPIAAEAYNGSIVKLINFHQGNAKLWSDEAIERSHFVITSIVIAMLLAIVVGITLSYYFSNNISKVLKDVSAMLSQGSSNIEEFADEIGKISNSLSSSITQQATALQQTTSAVQETSASVMSNAENAKRSTEASFQSSKSANEGKKAVDEVVHSIKEISESINEIKREVDENNKEIAGVVQIIHEIEEKTKVINEIVFQTKLLSFNASVEAARAGEHGKGFAVVAEEVGNLAQMSGKSATEITTLLDSSIEKVQSLVKNSKEKVGKIVDIATTKVDKGTSIANNCNATLSEIILQADRVTQMIEEISSSCNEQSQSIKEITNAMNEIDSASHSNSDSSTKAREFATHLNSELDGFRNIVIQLNEIVDGKKGAT